MTHVNPSPSQFPEVKRESRSNIHLSICFQDWILFVISALVSITILTFDLATDWMLWRLLSTLWIQKSLENVSHVGSEGAFAARLPVFFLTFLSLGTALYAGHVIYMIASFWLCRIRYRSKLDGILPKVDTFQKYAGDLLIGGQLLLQCLPLTALLFYLQLNVNCSFYFVFYDDALVMLSLASTCADVLWKCCQTAWNRRNSADDRDHYGGGTHALFAIRCFNWVLVCLVLCFVVLNFILISPIQKALPKSRLSSKLCLDSWARAEYVVFTIAIDSYIPDQADDYVNRSDSFSFSGTEYSDYEHVISLVPIYAHGRASVSTGFDDENDTSLLKKLAVLSESATLRHCTVAFSFKVQLADGHIEYNIAYSCHPDQDGDCKARFLYPAAFGTYSNRTTVIRLPFGKSYYDLRRPLPNITLDASDLPNSATTPPSGIRVFRPHVTLSGEFERMTRPCDIKFLLNRTLPLSTSLC
ncbi:hypothetical protein LSH36_2105g00001 [Paralvinella palmiformis]|jgi:hypothetical protein|uniref:Transmembrane protein n=1 Tax=Paralvinella palmiformis TaxID=53620 RepID=A0AAD9IS56_9ANNE|nr:hypothetical protein LSH36_2105g00001 [Paralvinella palmiformis]